MHLLARCTVRACGLRARVCEECEATVDGLLLHRAAVVWLEGHACVTLTAMLHGARDELRDAIDAMHRARVVMGNCRLPRMANRLSGSIREAERVHDRLRHIWERD